MPTRRSRDRQGPDDPGVAESDARPTWPPTPTRSSPRWRGSGVGGRLIASRRDGGQATAERGDDLERNFAEAARRSCASCARPWCGWRALADRRRPCSPTSRAARDDINTLFDQLGPFSNAALPALPDARPAAEIGEPGADEVRSDDQRELAEVRRWRPSRWPRTRALLLDSLPEDRRRGAPDGLHLLPGGRRQRLRPVGHYLRAGLIVNLCSTYATRPRRAARRTSSIAPPRARV